MGTKKLVEDFVDELTLQLINFAGDIDSINNHVELRMKADILRHLRHSIGNTALLLSGGGSLGIYHIGVVRGILEAGILPRIIAGSSVGAIVASLLCTRDEEEFIKLAKFDGLHFSFLEAPLGELSLWNNISKKLKRWFFEHAVYDSEYIESTLREYFGEITFLVLFIHDFHDRIRL